MLRADRASEPRPYFRVATMFPSRDRKEAVRESSQLNTRPPLPRTLRQKPLNQNAQVSLLLQRLKHASVDGGLLTNLAFAVDDGDLREREAVHRRETEEAEHGIPRHGPDREDVRVLSRVVAQFFRRDIVDRAAERLESAWSVLSLACAQQLRECLAMHAVGEQELHHHHFAFVAGHSVPAAGVDNLERWNRPGERRDGERGR